MFIPTPVGQKSRRKMTHSWPYTKSVFIFKFFLGCFLGCLRTRYVLLGSSPIHFMIDTILPQFILKNPT